MGIIHWDHLYLSCRSRVFRGVEAISKQTLAPYDDWLHLVTGVIKPSKFHSELTTISSCIKESQYLLKKKAPIFWCTSPTNFGFVEIYNLGFFFPLPKTWCQPSRLGPPTILICVTKASRSAWRNGSCGSHHVLPEFVWLFLEDGLHSDLVVQGSVVHNHGLIVRKSP